MERVKHYLEKIKGMSEAKDFGQLCPHPVLVALGGITEAESEFHTRVSATTDVLDFIERQHRFDPNARVLPVAKRHGANPYGQMIILGRTTNTDIQIKSSEISKMHAVITWQDGAQGRIYKIADGKSRNGTWLGPTRLRPQRIQNLESGAIIRLGRIMALRFYLPTDFYHALVKMGSS